MTTPLPEQKAVFTLEENIYSEDQLRQYGEAEYKRGLADAAELCDGQAKGWKERPFIAGCGGYVAAANCASYIRKLGENHEQRNRWASVPGKHINGSRF